MARSEDQKCLFCGELFRVDRRNARHQKYCPEPACRKASKAASQRAWLAKPENRDYFCGPEHVARVQSSGPATPAIGGGRRAQDAWCRRRRFRPLRYKMSTRRKSLKSMRFRQISGNRRYKISCLINPLF